MDIAEIDAPLRERFWMVILIVIASLFAAAAGVGFLWREQRMRFFREKYGVEKALAESEDKFRLLLDSTEEAIYEVDVQGLCTFCNPPASAFWDISDPKTCSARTCTGCSITAARTARRIPSRNAAFSRRS